MDVTDKGCTDEALAFPLGPLHARRGAMDPGPARKRPWGFLAAASGGAPWACARIVPWLWSSGKGLSFALTS